VTDHYDDVNAMWPETLPSCRADEAKRAAMNLLRRFAGKRVRYSNYARVRRCWIATKPPFNDLRRGWKRLVHDLSHITYRLTYNRRVFSSHGRTHADYERRMIAHVLAEGWLTGVLRDKPVPTETAGTKLERIMERIARWESKLRRAETALKKLHRRRKYYESR
jgi:hypothetical protein